MQAHRSLHMLCPAALSGTKASIMTASSPAAPSPLPPRVLSIQSHVRETIGHVGQRNVQPAATLGVQQLCRKRGGERAAGRQAEGLRRLILH